MVARFTDKERKMIIVDYMESGSYKATSKRFQIADNTVKRICQSEPEILQKVVKIRKNSNKKSREYHRHAFFYGFQKEKGPRCYR